MNLHIVFFCVCLRLLVDYGYTLTLKCLNLSKTLPHHKVKHFPSYIRDLYVLGIAFLKPILKLVDWYMCIMYDETDTTIVI